MFEQTQDAFEAMQKKKKMRIIDHQKGADIHEWLLLVNPRGRPAVRARTAVPGYIMAMFGEDYPAQLKDINAHIDLNGIQVPKRMNNEMLMLVRVKKI